MKNSTGDQMVVLAFDKGYRVTNAGQVRSRLGRVRKLRKHLPGGARSPYLKFTVKVPTSDTRYPVPVHRLAAFQRFGEAALEYGVQVRHLNGDSLDNRLINLALGTPSQNALDRPAHDRRAHAQLAGMANAKSDEIWDKVKVDYASGMGYKRLRKKYGIHLSTLSYRLSKGAKKRKQEV